MSYANRLRLLLLVLVTIKNTVFWSQLKITSVDPIIGLETHISSGWSSNINAYNAQAGVLFNKRIAFLVNGGINYTSFNNDNVKGFHYWSTSFSARFRILKEHHIASPIIQLNYGSGFKNNNYTVNLSNEYYLVNSIPSSYEIYGVYSHFNRFNQFGSISLGMELSFKRLFFQLTVGRQYKSMQFSDHDNTSETFTIKGYSWMTSLSASYFLNSHKKL